eukprot:XP_002260860.1 hypothetical protein, conserved in Plasmodium species [Plasmodium knowlesi strain H]
MDNKKHTDFPMEHNLSVSPCVYEQHQLDGAPSCFAKRKGKLFLLAREPLEDTINRACMDTLHIAERVKGEIINELISSPLPQNPPPCVEFHLILVLYTQILKAKKAQNKVNRGENKNKKYLQKVFSICDTLSKLLMKYNQDIVANQPGKEIPMPRDGDVYEASGEDTLVQNDFSTRNCIRCLHMAEELNETEYYDPHRKIKPFRFFQLGDTKLALQDRKKLKKKFNRICQSKSYLLKQRRSNTSSRDESLSKGGMNHLSNLERILLGINRTVTTFGTDNNGNINAIIEFFTPYGVKEKNVINMNEYDYFFCTSSDESVVQSSTNGQPQKGRTQKGKPLSNRNNVFYVGNKKVILNKKKKEKIIFQMDPNGILTKEIFKKGKKNENIFIKSFKENEWSDDHVDFCYLNEQKKKEKIVITKTRDGIRKRIFRDHELNGGQESFDFYRRGIFSIRDVHLYDDAEAMAFRILKEKHKVDQINSEKEKLVKEKKNFNVAQIAKVTPTYSTPVHTNEWSLEKGEACSGSSKEYSLESIFTKLKKRKERYLKAIYLCTDKETGPIRKSQKLRRIKMHLNGGEMKKQPMGKRLTGKVPIAEREKAVHPVSPEMDPPILETRIGKVKNGKMLHRGWADAPLQNCTGPSEKKREMDRDEKAKGGEKSKFVEKAKRGEKSKKDKQPLRGRLSTKNGGHPIRVPGERTDQGKHVQDESPKESKNIKVGESTMIYSKNENAYMNIYNEVKENNKTVAVGTYSMAKLASIIERSHAEGDNPETHDHKKTNKKIEEFVFDENLKEISITSHSVSRKSSKNCIKYHVPQGEVAQKESSHIFNGANERREGSGKESQGPENVKPNDYSNYNGEDLIKAIPTGFSKEDAPLDGETVPTKLPTKLRTYGLPNHPDGTTDNNIFKKSYNSLSELSKIPSAEISENTMGNLRDHVRRQLSDSQGEELSHQLSRQLSSQTSHQLSSQMSHQLSSQMSHQLSSQMSHQIRIEEKEHSLKNRQSEVRSGLKSDAEESKEEESIANAAAIAVETEDNVPKGGLQEVNGPLEEEKEKRQQYLSKGFPAYAHVVLSESNVITRKCTVFFDYATKKLSILRNKKLFNIDVDKLYVQEIPTYEVDVGVIELLFPKKRSRVLLLESRDLVGLQNLGNEIGWISTPNDRLDLHRGGSSLDAQRPAPQNMEGRKKDITYKLNNQITKKKISFFDKIKLNNFLGKKK